MSNNNKINNSGESGGYGQFSKYSPYRVNPDGGETSGNNNNCEKAACGNGHEKRGYSAGYENAADGGNYYGGRYQNLHRNNKVPVKKSYQTIPGKERVLIVMITVLCFAVCLLAYFFNSLSGGAVNLTADAKTYYAVSAGSFAGVDAARVRAEEIKSMKGAGFILEDKQFVVLTAAYTKESDAVTVAGNTDGEVYKLEAAALKKNIKYNDSELTAINNAVKFMPQLADNMISISIRFDKGELSETECFYLLDCQREIINSHALKIAAFTSAGVTLKILTALNTASSLINNITDINSLSQNTASLIRYATVNIIQSYARLVSEISNTV